MAVITYTYSSKGACNDVTGGAGCGVTVIAGDNCRHSGGGSWVVLLTSFIKQKFFAANVEAVVVRIWWHSATAYRINYNVIRLCEVARFGA